MNNKHFGKLIISIDQLEVVANNKKCVIGNHGFFSEYKSGVGFTGKKKQMTARWTLNMSAILVNSILKQGLYIYITKKELKENE